MLVVPPGGWGGVGGGKRTGGQCLWWVEEGISLVPWKACRAAATHSQGLGIEVAEGIGSKCLLPGKC